jgi:uncharacterized protein (TIGR00369 family)
MTELEPGARALVQNAIVDSPYGKLLGVQLVSAEIDAVDVRLPYREAVTTLGDVVHGGAIASLIDVAATAAFWAKNGLGPATRGTTIALSLQFRAAGRGADLVAKARVARRGKDISFGDVSVVDPGGREVASAIVTYKLSG